MRTSFDAIVIGAGPAGSTAAALLARAGWAVALVERERFPRRKVCGECIAASNLPLLRDLGLGAALQAAGPELRRFAIWRGSDAAIVGLPAATDARDAWGRALGRETLDALLLECARAAGAQVFQPWTALALDGRPGDWRCELRAASRTPARLGEGDHLAKLGSPGALRLRAPLAIDAHGSWGLAASGAVANAPRRAAGDLLAFKASFHGAALAPGLLPVLALDGGYGGMVLADGGLATLACCMRRDRLEALRRAAPGESAGAVVERWLRASCAGVDAALQGARRAGTWLATGPIAPGVRLRRSDGLLRIGNAAGEAHPILGEGISMALQSAALLAGLLRGAAGAGADQAAELARTYVRLWRRHFGARLLVASAFAQLAMRPSGAALLVALARHAPAALALGVRCGGKLHSAVEVETSHAGLGVRIDLNA